MRRKIADKVRESRSDCSNSKFWGQKIQFKVKIRHEKSREDVNFELGKVFWWSDCSFPVSLTKIRKLAKEEEIEVVWGRFEWEREMDGGNFIDGKRSTTIRQRS